jgi:methyl-accepting chemotaxis protein
MIFIGKLDVSMAEISKGISQTKTKADELSKLAGQLREMTNKFKI